MSFCSRKCCVYRQIYYTIYQQQNKAQTLYFCTLELRSKIYYNKEKVIVIHGENMNIQYSKRSVKAINGMDKPTKHRIRFAIEAIPNGDIKPLKGLDGSYRLRVGDWRIIFSYPDDNTVLVEKIAPRGEVYKGV